MHGPLSDDVHKVMQGKAERKQEEKTYLICELQMRIILTVILITEG